MIPAVLAIDLGSSTVKAAVVDHGGALRGTGDGTIDLILGENGAAEQSPHQLWSAVVGACRQAIDASSAGAAEIVAIACSSQYSSVVPVDAAGEPAANLILWRDTRGAKHARALVEGNPDARAAWTEIHGLPPSLEGRDTLAHMLYVKHEAPDVYARTAAFLEPVDYLNLRFSGVTAANQCSVYKMLLTDNRQSNANAYDPTLMALAGIGADKLPPLIDVDAVVGALRADVADELGLAAGIAVLGGVNDNHAVALATGALEKRRAGLSIGTTANISALIHGLKSDPARRLSAMPSPLPGRNMVMAENGLGGKVLELILRRLFFPDAEAGSDAPFAEVERAAVRGAPEPASASGKKSWPRTSSSTLPPRPFSAITMLRPGSGLGIAEMRRAGSLLRPWMSAEMFAVVPIESPARRFSSAPVASATAWLSLTPPSTATPAARPSASATSARSSPTTASTSISGGSLSAPMPASAMSVGSYSRAFDWRLSVSSIL